MMAELISMTYEQARAEHFKALKDEAKHKMYYWATRVRRSRPNDLNDPAHIRSGEYAAEYSYYKDALEALEAGKDINAPTTQPKWISVEERLPEESGTVLVYRDGCCGVARLLDVEPAIMWTYTGFGGDPTHWMPLPSGPKEEV